MKASLKSQRSATSLQWASSSEGRLATTRRPSEKQTFGAARTQACKPGAPNSTKRNKRELALKGREQPWPLYLKIIIYIYVCLFFFMVLHQIQRTEIRCFKWCIIVTYCHYHSYITLLTFLLLLCLLLSVVTTISYYSYHNIPQWVNHSINSSLYVRTCLAGAIKHSTISRASVFADPIPATSCRICRQNLSSFAALVNMVNMGKTAKWTSLLQSHIWNANISGFFKFSFSGGHQPSLETAPNPGLRRLHQRKYQFASFWTLINQSHLFIPTFQKQTLKCLANTLY